MKPVKPGQFRWPNGHWVRAVKRTCGCKGCIFEDDIYNCPNIRTRTNRDRVIDCALYGIIFVVVNYKK